MNDGLSSERDLKPLFRERDRATMLERCEVRSLWKRTTLLTTSQAITRLEDGSMPCDEAWPADRIETFRRWVEAGCRLANASQRLSQRVPPTVNGSKGVVAARSSVPGLPRLGETVPEVTGRPLCAAN